MNRSGTEKHWILMAGSLLVICAAVSWAVRETLAEESPEPRSSSTISVKPTPTKFPVIVNKPAGPPRVDLGILDATGKPVTAACSTCHATRPTNHANRVPADLEEFHQNMAFAHGKVSCLSCHNPNDYDALRLADGKPVEYSEVMTLCAQCHGPQTRDYWHGAHGGMNGYWDLTRGPRTRNNCVDCHSPHAPGFPAMQPTFKPRDRFLSSSGSASESPTGDDRHE